MLSVGFVGWRGMVGSVLMARMREEGDFAGLDARFFSTSNPGGTGPAEAGGAPLLDAYDLPSLAACDVIVTAQGSAYTQQVHGPLRADGWSGLFIDASSALRLDDDALLVLDPVNGDALRQGLVDGTKVFCGANCTVSLLLLGLLGLVRTGEVEWIASSTYQAASGAGAKLMRELVRQMKHVGDAAAPALSGSALDLDSAVADALASAECETAPVPLAGSALPWIDKLMPTGQTREEWKAEAEASRLLGRRLIIDGVCVRIGSLRSHAQAVTIKTKRPLPLDEVRQALAEAHPWARVVPNEPEATLAHLTPAAVAGTLSVPVGRLRPMAMGPDHLAAFTVGDQLLWGAAEPLRRMLRLVREHRE
jgi:aspartate-semialdehyde dehydrogenase